MTTITVYETKCRLCHAKIRASSEEQYREALGLHLDNTCKTAATMRDWEKQGIYKQMMSLFRAQALDEDLQKLLKHYSFKEIRQALEDLEIAE